MRAVRQGVEVAVMLKQSELEKLMVVLARGSYKNGSEYGLFAKELWEELMNVRD